MLTHSIAALSRQAAKGFLERHKRRLLDAKDVAKSQVAEIDGALDQLISGAFVMGEHHATLLTFGDSADEVRSQQAEAVAAAVEAGTPAPALPPARPLVERAADEVARRGVERRGPSSAPVWLHWLSQVDAALAHLAELARAAPRLG